MKKTILRLLAVLAMGWMCCGAQPAPLPPNLQEVVKLTQAHMGDDVIIAYIRNSGASYSLSADEILYMNSQGVSQPVISALLHSQPNAPAPAPGVPPPPAGGPAPVAQPSTPPPALGESAPQPPPNPEVDLPYFQAQLSPAGEWVDVPGYGQCWRPAVAIQDPDWRPYCDAGHWVYTDDGWTWQSDYPWGDIAFHYGRWFRDERGWAWMPGYNWAPAWVSWRHAEGEGFCGWAPLPPDARFDVGVGFSFHGQVGLDFDFGLPASAYVFVPFDHFWVNDYRAWRAPMWRADVLFRGSVVINDYHFANGHFVVGGLGRDRMEQWTHHPIEVQRVVIHDEHIAAARDMQHVRSAEVRHDISHEDAMRQERDIRQAHPQATRGGGPTRREDSGRDGEHNQRGGGF